MKKRIVLFSLFLFLFFLIFPNPIEASGFVDIQIGNEEGEGWTDSINIFILIAVLSLAPSLFILLTCFTKVIIVLSLTRQGMGTPTIPPNQVLMALALFITIYIMMPVFKEVNEVAYQPLKNEQIQMEEAIKRAEVPLKAFMLANTSEDDLMVFMKLREDETPEKKEDVSIWAVIPAYTLSQITEGLIMGLKIFIAFVVIDLIVGSVLMFMGMMMLPPTMISLPLKILIFIYIGGFNQVIETIFTSIRF